MSEADAAAESTGSETINYEETAKVKGWKPLAEYDGDKSGWVSAEEFVKREPLFDRIKHQSKELKELRKTIDSMAQFHHKSVEAQVTQAISALKAQRKEAIELGDADKVDALDEELQKAKQEKDSIKAPTAAIPAEIETWLSENTWFEKNDDMATFARAWNEAYLRKNPGELEESLKKTTEAVKKAFPEEFGKPAAPSKKDSPGAVEAPSGSTSPSSAKNYSVSRLTSEQKLVYDQYVNRHKIMKHEEYFKSLEDIGELK